MTARGRPPRRACASVARAACVASAATTSPWPTSSVAGTGRFVAAAARFAIRARRRLPREATMPRERCLISFRLAGVCRTCKRATWPAHIAADLSVYCADCCEACRLDRAPVENPRAKTARRRTVRSARPGKGGGDTGPPEPGPCCAVSGPARDAASVKPSEVAPGRKGRAADRGPCENRLAKGPLAGAVALPGPEWWGSTGRPETGPPKDLSCPAGPSRRRARAGELVGTSGLAATAEK
jgi:hypothetical protein